MDTFTNRLIQESRQIFLDAQRRYQRNRNDGQAAFILFNSYKWGRGGVSADEQLAESYLQAAARCRDADALRELENRNGLQREQQRSVQMDARRAAAARDKLRNTSGLIAEIKQKIFPLVVSIVRNDGCMGTGFFRHDTWLVSNAHVLPSKEVLAYSTVYDHIGNEGALIPNNSFHRPVLNLQAPDITLVNTDFNSLRKLEYYLPGVETEDNRLEERYYFYVDINIAGDKTYQIKFLRLLSPEGSYPLIYQCQDNISPQPGSSGSPIIEARVTIGANPKWDFKLVSTLYARCDPAWANSQLNAQTPTETAAVTAEEDAKLVCAIPVDREFEQILSEILLPDNFAQRARDMTAAARLVKDGAQQTEQYTAQQLHYDQLKARGLEEYQSGKTSLYIELPPGLERLWHGDIVKIEYSLLIPSLLKKVTGRAGNEFPKEVRARNKEQLYTDFDDLIAQIRKLSCFELKEVDDALKHIEALSGNAFRIDNERIDNIWRIEIQDNTGKGNTYKDKSLSSIFAIARLPIATKIIGYRYIVMSREPNEAELQLANAGHTILFKRGLEEDYPHKWSSYYYNEVEAVNDFFARTQLDTVLDEPGIAKTITADNELITIKEIVKRIFPVNHEVIDGEELADLLVASRNSLAEACHPQAQLEINALPQNQKSKAKKR